MKFIGRWIATAVAVAAAAWIVPGFSVAHNTETWIAVAALGLVLTLLNGTVKPILKFLSLPVTIVTLGVFHLVINTIVLYLAAYLTTGLFDVIIVILNFGSGLAASVVISLVTVLVSGVVGVKD